MTAGLMSQEIKLLIRDFRRFYLKIPTQPTERKYWASIVISEVFVVSVAFGLIIALLRG